MGEKKSCDITGITVRYSDGSTKEIQSGCCVDLEKGSDDLSVEMLNVKPFAMKTITYSTPFRASINGYCMEILAPHCRHLPRRIM